MSYRKVTLLLLAILALTILSWDYTCGHTFEDFVNLEYCPFCDSFQFAEIGVLLLIFLVCVGLAPVIGRLVISPVLFIPSFVVLSITPDRAPPACC